MRSIQRIIRSRYWLAILLASITIQLAAYPHAEAIQRGNPDSPLDDNRAELAVMVASPHPVQKVNQPVIFTVTVKNIGKKIATSTILTTTVDLAITKTLTLEADSTPCQQIDRIIQCDIGNLEIHSEKVITITAIMPKPALLTTAAKVESAQAEFTTLDNESEASVSVDWYHLFLPLLGNQATNLPDLVVQEFGLKNGRVAITITNTGDHDVTTPFWVDLYINPFKAPAGPNDIWENLGPHGVAWGIDETQLPFKSGDTLTLMVGDPLYVSRRSNPGVGLDAGDQVYIQVDSYAVGSSYGAVFERDELIGASNDIYHTVAPSSMPFITTP